MKRAILTLSAGLALAAGPATPDLSAIAGLYGYHFRNGLIDGSKYWSDDVLEIVPLDARRAYVRAELKFYNGHSCSIYGVAHRNAGVLVYRPREQISPEYHCALRVTATARTVRLDDDNTCLAYCGARGSLNEVVFERARRRPISYMARLRASSEFKAALAEDRGEKTK